MNFKNNYKICGDKTYIELQRKSGEILITVIDTEDLERISKTNFKFYPYEEKKNNTFYAVAAPKSEINKSGFTMVQLHRLIMNTPKGLVVDHVNHDPLDNRKCNLRNVSIIRNSQNRKGAQKDSKSGIRGVHFNKKINKWIAQITVNKEKKYLGCYSDIDIAEKVATEAREKYFI